MIPLRRAVGFLLAAVLLLLAGSLPSQALTTGGRSVQSRRSVGPPLHTPLAVLDRAVRCSPLANPHNPKRTLLLVHGTAGTPEDVWGWAFERQLTADGFGWCDVRLPDRALGNFTVAAEYAVNAARVAYRRSGKKIALVGHSQGAAMVLWIAKFWPDVARHASDVISLAGPLRGTTVANALCVIGRCAPISWQMTHGGHTMNALERAPMPRGVPITSIATRLDELITPQPAASSSPGIHTIEVQDVCPGHVVEHALLSSDPVAYALMLDAVTHRGTARASRIPRSVCSELVLPKTDLAGAAGSVNVITSFLEGLANPLTWVAREPRLPLYARRYGR
jgi:pimeloyl-ACP methyl ester carboxylesterase